METLDLVLKLWPVLIILGGLIATVVRLKSHNRELRENIERHKEHISSLLTFMNESKVKLAFVFNSDKIKSEIAAATTVSESTISNTRRVERLENHVFKSHRPDFNS